MLKIDLPMLKIDLPMLKIDLPYVKSLKCKQEENSAVFLMDIAIKFLRHKHLKSTFVKIKVSNCRSIHILSVTYMQFLYFVALN
mgnify:CR=1 FL=1